MDLQAECHVTRPSCFETFTVAGPAPTEVPAEWDYDGAASPAYPAVDS